MFKKPFVYFCLQIMIAPLPFMAIGMLGENAIIYPASAVGIIGLIGAIVGMATKPNPLFAKIGSIRLGDYFFPYVIALSTAIYESHGAHVTFGYWFSLALVLLVFIAWLLPDKSRTK